MKTKNELTVKRVYFIALLIFGINFLPPMIAIMDQGVFPTAVEVVRSVFVGVLQIVTVLYALLERDKKQAENHAKEKAKKESDTS